MFSSFRKRFRVGFFFSCCFLFFPGLPTLKVDENWKQKNRPNVGLKRRNCKLLLLLPESIIKSSGSQWIVHRKNTFTIWVLLSRITSSRVPWIWDWKHAIFQFSNCLLDATMFDLLSFRLRKILLELNLCWIRWWCEMFGSLKGRRRSFASKTLDYFRRRSFSGLFTMHFLLIWNLEPFRFETHSTFIYRL